MIDENRNKILLWLDKHLNERAGIKWHKNVRTNETWMTGRISGIFTALKSIQEVTHDQGDVMLEVAWSEVYNDLPRYLRAAIAEELWNVRKVEEDTIP